MIDATTLGVGAAIVAPSVVAIVAEEDPQAYVNAISIVALAGVIAWKVLVKGDLVHTRVAEREDRLVGLIEAQNVTANRIADQQDSNTERWVEARSQLNQLTEAAAVNVEADVARGDLLVRVESKVSDIAPALVEIGTRQKVVLEKLQAQSAADGGS